MTENIVEIFDVEDYKRLVENHYLDDAKIIEKKDSEVLIEYRFEPRSEKYAPIIAFRRLPIFNSSEFLENDSENIFYINSKFVTSDEIEKCLDKLDKEKHRAIIQCAFFEDDVNFSGVVFDDNSRFIGSRFGDRTNFSKTEFGDGTIFYVCKFGNGTNFYNAQFSDSALFKKNEFGDGTLFNTSSFGNIVDFTSSKFKDGTSFEYITFNGDAIFSRTEFGNLASFKHSVFNKQARFKETSFRGMTNFTETAFKGETTFFDESFDLKRGLDEGEGKNIIINQEIIDFSDSQFFTKSKISARYKILIMRDVIIRDVVSVAEFLKIDLTRITILGHLNIAGKNYMRKRIYSKNGKIQISLISWNIF